jgi:hypothetical protein
LIAAHSARLRVNPQPSAFVRRLRAKGGECALECLDVFAVYVERPNPDNVLDALIVGERDAPVAPDGWARMRMTAASLNWHDLWTLRGLGAANGRPEVFPMILGCDGVGRLDDGALTW